MLLFAGRVVGVIPEDPFAHDDDGQTNMLLAAVQSGKPLALDVCYGEVTEPAPTAPDQNAQGPDGAQAQTIVITDAFLKRAKRLQIAVNDTDLGHVYACGKINVTYQLSPVGDAHSLKFRIEVLHDTGRSQISSTVTLLTNGQWMVFDGLTRPHVSNDVEGDIAIQKNYVFAIRLASR
ncbi:MAG: hypothetical protein ABII82_19375 [Verrucomicrobiota bacterium]